MFSMVFVWSGSVSFDRDQDSGFGHLLIRNRIQDNETDFTIPDPQHCVRLSVSVYADLHNEYRFVSSRETECGFSRIRIHRHKSYLLIFGLVSCIHTWWKMGFRIISMLSTMKDRPAIRAQWWFTLFDNCRRFVINRWTDWLQNLMVFMAGKK